MSNLSKSQRICYVLLSCYVLVKLLQDLQLLLATGHDSGQDGPSLLRRLPNADDESRNKTKLLLTLFTTLPIRRSDDNVTALVIRNWSDLGPDIQPYLFYLPGQEGVISSALSRGWRVMPVPRKNMYSVPYLKDMYKAVSRMSDSVFLGFCNADILFDGGLRATLRALADRSHDLDRMLVIGRRTTIELAEEAEVIQHYVSDDVVNVGQLAKIGVLDRADAEDYFLVTPSFPWQLFPDLVVGRKGYDNFLVARSIHNNLTVIDGTQTIVSVHLKKPKSLRARRTGDHLFNKYRLINKFDYMKAMTISAPYYTSVEGGRIQLKKRVYDDRFKNVKWR